MDQLSLFPPEPEPASPATPETAAPALRSGMAVSAAIQAWADYLAGKVKQGEMSRHTPKSFLSDLRLLARHLGPRRALSEASTAELEAWLNLQQASGLSPKTHSRRVISVKSFFRWLTENGALSADPAAPLIHQTVLSPLPEYLTEKEIQAALQAAQAMRDGDRPDPRPQALLTLLLQTGIKKGECLALHPGDALTDDPQAPALWVRIAGRPYKERKLRLDPGWLTDLQALLDYRRDYLARHAVGAALAQKLFPWSPRRLEYLLEDVGQAAGLKKHLSFEMCRWTCAVREARAGLDPDRLRQKLGLSRIQWREIGQKLTRLTGPAL